MRHAKTMRVLEAAYAILLEANPMTLRQLHYQLVSRQVTENTRTSYQALSNMIVDARLDGTISWEWIEDRLRRPRRVAMWPDTETLATQCYRQYRRDVWENQTRYLEVWLEKDALSGIFEDVLEPYGVTLNVGRGYDGWDSIYNASQRFGAWEEVTVLYFGDFDPSGEDMVRSLQERLGRLGAFPDVIKAALNPNDIDQYSLPPAMAKRSDTRTKAFIEQHGDVSVELDAMPTWALKERVESSVKEYMDMDALQTTLEIEESDKAHIHAWT